MSRESYAGRHVNKKGSETKLSYNYQSVITTNDKPTNGQRTTTAATTLSRKPDSFEEELPGNRQQNKQLTTSLPVQARAI